MIVWLNGTFGAGKTSVARELVRLLPSARIFDSEYVGFMLRHVLATEKVADFQDWPPWRALVAETANRVLAYVGGILVVPQTILVQAYAEEILAALSAEVHHFVLHAPEDELRRRIEADTEEPGARQWRLDHLTTYRAALPWLRTCAQVIDTAGRTPIDVAQGVADSVQASEPRSAIQGTG